MKTLAIFIKWTLAFFILFAMNLHKPSPDLILSARIGKVQREVNNVNQGGCGYHAKYVKLYLDSQGIQSTLVVIWKPFHIMNKVGDTYIDRNGFFSTAYPSLWFKHDTISMNQLQRWLNNADLWNTNFNRADSAKLRKILLE